MSIPVFIPILSFLARIPSGNISCVKDLLSAISAISKENDLRLRGWENQEILLSQLSLRLLVFPVSLEPRHNFGDRLAHSATAAGWVAKEPEDQVQSEWSDPEKIHVIIYIDRGPMMRAAENLHRRMWGQDLNTLLSEVNDHDGVPWKCLQNDQCGWLELAAFGYTEEMGLLIRAEYDVALGELRSKQEKHNWCRGVVVIGQPGVGKTCFLYYVLLYLLSQKVPVAFQLSGNIIVFQDGNVFMYSHSAGPFVLPPGTWALADSDDQIKRPCNTFRDAAKRKIAWVVQTSSPLESRYKEWQKQLHAETFVMDCIPPNEITALSTLSGINRADLQRVYENWGPSARTCLSLARNPKLEHGHESAVMSSATRFIRNSGDFSPLSYDAVTVHHRLFSLHPETKSEEGRQVLTAVIATDRIKAIISYAAVDVQAEDRVKFYYMISKEPMFGAAQGKMFERFVLTWLSSRDMAPLSCTPTNAKQPKLKIPSCGCDDDTHKICGSLNDFRTTTVNTLPFCFLPSSTSFATADAVVLTEQFIITIQVTIASSHDAKGRGFADIKASLPAIPGTPENPWRKNKRPWCHVFVTDDDDKARKLRNQKLSELPEEVHVYSAVFDVGFKLDSKRMRKLDEARQQADESMVIE